MSDPERKALRETYEDVRHMLASGASMRSIMMYFERNQPKYRPQVGQGGRLTPQHVQQSLQQMAGRLLELDSVAPDPVSGTIMSGFHGATFGLIDDVLDLVGQEEAAEGYRERREAFRGEHPWMSGLAEFGGGMAVPGLSAVKGLRTGSTALRAGGKGALVGGVEGAVAGFGESEGTAVERLLSTATGAAIGAGTGGVIGAGTHGGRAARKAVTGHTGRSVKEEAREFVQSGLEQSERGIEGVLEGFERSRELVPTARLAAEREMQVMTRDAARYSQEAKDMLRSAGRTDLPAASTRASDMLAQTLGADDLPDMLKARASRLATVKEQGELAYEALESVSIPAQNMAAYLRSEEVVSIIDEMNLALRRTRRPTRDVIRTGDDGRVEIIADQIDFRFLQDIKDQLKSRISRRANSGDVTSPVQREDIRLLDQYNDAMLDEINKLPEGQRAWFTYREHGRALEEGMGAVGKTSTEILEDIGGEAPKYTGEFAETYREAAIESIAQRVRMRGSEQDVSDFLTRSQEMRDKLDVLFPDPERAQRFLDQMEVEGRTFELFKGSKRGTAIPSRDLAQEISSGMKSETGQRIGAAFVAPWLQGGRLAADIQHSTVGKAARKRAEEVGGLLTKSTLGEPGGLDARNLLTGSRGSIAPGLLSRAAFRSPAALLLAMRGN